MPYPTGQLVSAPLSNGFPQADFGTHISYLGVGGYREVPTLADRNAIPTKAALEYDGLGSGQRRHLMLVAVQETGLVYILFKENFTTLGSAAAQLAALKDNTNWVLFSDFLHIQSEGNPELPNGKYTPRTLFVQGFGQTEKGIPGNPLRPYQTITAAVEAAQNNDTIVIYAGGDDIDYLGRPCYSDNIGTNNKSLNFIFEGGIISGYWIFGTYPGLTTSVRCSIRNGVFTNGIAIIGSNGQQCRYYFDGCSFEDKSSINELVPSGFEQVNLNPGLDIQHYTNCRFENTKPINGGGVFNMQSRDDATPTQHINIVLQDCQATALNTPIATGYASIYTLVYLRGSTELIVKNNQAIQKVTRANSSSIIGDGEIFIDERTKSTTSPGVLIFDLDEYIATEDGEQRISLPKNTSGVFDINVLEHSGNCRPLYQKHYTVDNTFLIVSALSNIKLNDRICGSYYSNSNTSFYDGYARSGYTNEGYVTK